MNERLNLSGSMVAIVTPMTADGELDLAALTALIKIHETSGTKALVVAGTTGESASLSNLEYQRLIEHTVAHANGMQVIAGAGSPSTAKTVELAALAESSGAQALLCVTPYYLKTSQAGLLAHYNSIVNNAGLPVILYNVPARTGVDLLPETISRLSRLSSVVAIKEAVAGPERTAQILSDCEEGFTVLSGDDGTALAAMKAGARGVISVTANIAPAAMSELCHLALAEDWVNAQILDQRLAQLHQLLMAEPNPMPVKALLCRMGWIKDGIRLPLVKASVDLINKLELEVKDALADIALSVA